MSVDFKSLRITVLAPGLKYRVTCVVGAQYRLASEETCHWCSVVGDLYRAPLASSLHPPLLGIEWRKVKPVRGLVCTDSK